MKVRALVPALVAALALAGCGSSGDGSDGSGRSAAPSSGRDAAPATSVPGRAGITAGRVGPAVTATDGGELVEIDPGGRIDPRLAVPGKRQREGVGAGAACQNVDVMPTSENLAVVDAAVLCLLNGERADRGLRAVVGNSRLAQAAMRQSRDMVEKSYFAHRAPDGTDVVARVRATGYFDGTNGWSVGENLAWGTGSLATPRSIMNAWMNSEGHKANILRPEYREIGVGTVLGNPRSTDGEGATYTHVFGARDGVEPVAEDGSSPVAGNDDVTSPTAGTPTTTTRVAGAGVTKRALQRVKRTCRTKRSIRRIRSVKARKAAVKRCSVRAARAAARRAQR